MIRTHDPDEYERWFKRWMAESKDPSLRPHFTELTDWDSVPEEERCSLEYVFQWNSVFRANYENGEFCHVAVKITKNSRPKPCERPIKPGHRYCEVHERLIAQRGIK